jgi:hypothetical protein
MSLLPSTHSNNLSPKRGIAKFAPFNTDGSRQSQIQMSPSSDMTLTPASDKAEYISQESGLAEKLDTTVLSLTREIKITCNNLSNEIKALYFIADVTDLTQATASVTNEISPYVQIGRSIQMGGTTNNSAGVFGVSAETISSSEGLNATGWVTLTAYAQGAVAAPTTPNLHWYMATTGGTAAASEPTWPTDGSTVTDGTVTWQDMGLIEYVANTDYELDGDYGVINIPSTGAMATAIALVPAVLRAAGVTFHLSSDYTRAAKTVSQLATKENATVEGEFWFYEQNPKGDNNVWYCPKVTLSPDGDFLTKSASDYGSVGFLIDVLKPATGSSIYQNGVPVS